MRASTSLFLCAACASAALASSPKPAWTARGTAHSVLLRVHTKGAFAERALNAAFANAKGLSPVEVVQATEMTYGVLRTQALLDFHLQRLVKSGRDDFRAKTPAATLCALRLGAYELLHMSTPEYAAVDRAVALAGRARAQRSFTNGVLRNLARARDAGRLPSPSDDASLSPLEALAIESSMPLWVLKELEGSGLLGSFEELRAFAIASQQRPALTLRVNPRRATTDHVVALLADAGVPASRGVSDVRPSELRQDVTLDGGGGAVSRLPGFADGLWSVQDLGAQCVGRLAAPSASASKRATVSDAHAHLTLSHSLSLSLTTVRNPRHGSCAALHPPTAPTPRSLTFARHRAARRRTWRSCAPTATCLR